MSFIRSASGFVTAAVLLAGCYSLDRRDFFEVPFKPPSAQTLAALSDADHQVRALAVPGAPRPVSAYWDDGQDARGFLIFFDGNGYGAEAAMRRLLVPARALRLDLVVFDYYDAGQTPPSVAETRQVGAALYDAVAALRTPARRMILDGGHSLGASFALALAGERPVDGVFVAAPMTTGVAMIRHQIPISRVALLRPDADYGGLDNVAAGARVKAPALIVGSDGDRSLPPRFTHAVYAALPAATRKREVILSGVSHSDYFARPAFWAAVASFFGLKPGQPPVGYLKGGPA